MDDAMFKLDFDMGDLLQWLLAQFNCKTLSEMADYDPNKHIGDLQNKFKKLLEGFTFTDNDAIKDLFGLPIDFKSMKGKKPIPEGPKGAGMRALKVKAPEVAAKMGYKNGGAVMVKTNQKPHMS